MASPGMAECASHQKPGLVVHVVAGRGARRALGVCLVSWSLGCSSCHVLLASASSGPAHVPKEGKQAPALLFFKKIFYITIS